MKSLVKFSALFILALVLCVANLSCAVVRLGPNGEIKGIDIILKPVGQLPTIDSFNASPSSITSADTSTLDWNVSEATEVSIDQGIGSVSPTGNVEVSPTATTTYTITATNAAGSATQQVTVTVAAAPPPSLPVILSFTASPSSISTGGSSTLDWNVSGATSVSIVPGAASVPASGSATASPDSTTTYTLTATNAAGTVTQSVTVAVTEAPTPSPTPTSLPVILAFAAEPTSISAGNNSNLRWNVYGASSIYIDNGVGTIPYTAGYVSVHPYSTTTYTLTATNAAGTATRQVTVTVAAAPPPSLPVILSFTASPSSISAGGNSTISWNVTGATSVSISPGGGAVPASGSATASPASTTTYTITATNAAGSVTQQVTVTVAAAPPPSPPPSGDAATCEQALFDAVNALRTANGRAALTRNAYIDGLCRQHAQYMASAGTLSHDNFSTRCSSIMASFPAMHSCAENVLQNNLPCDANAMAQQWFASPGHHDNMLNAAYTISGMGIEIDGTGRIWACQMFAGP